MLLLGVVLGLLVGLLLGGRLANLVNVRLRWPAVIFLAVFLRYGTEAAIERGVGLADALRLPLFLFAFGLLIAALWQNRDRPGLLMAAGGVAANALAITVNKGWMPVWGPALRVAGFSTGDLSTSFHCLLPDALGAQFLLQAGPLGGVLPLPLPFVANVASVGDVFLATGLGWFVFSTLVRGSREAGLATAREAVPPRPYHAFGDAWTLDQPVLLGGQPGAEPLPIPGRLSGGPARGDGGLLDRIRGHAYVRLALDARFSAFWLGQTISLFGDRIHQVALAVLVYGRTSSPFLTGLVFLAATLPNLLLGPVAGTFVDRWDHKHVLIASDVIRAGLVLGLPVAALTEIALVYPIVFAVTTVSIFFRPAKTAVVPRIVRPDDLMAANSATWTGETLADIAGYPLAGLLVAFLGSSLSLAFWIDSASYLLSALLVLGLAIPPVVREATPVAARGLRRFVGELVDGWRFLRGQAVLFQNTLISAIAQTSIGATLALTVVYARDALDPALIGYPQNYAAIETAIGVGNLVGGLAVGALGSHLRKGWLVVGGFVVMGLATVFLGLTQNVGLAIAAAVVIGVANLVFIIPSQTLFGQLTPPVLMGRVVAFRSSFVFGAMTGAMAVSGLLAELLPVGAVIAIFGGVTALAGGVAAMLPAVRDA